jgi:hypothetical protein
LKNINVTIAMIVINFAEYDEESDTDDSDTEMEDESAEPVSSKTESRSDYRTAAESKSEPLLSKNSVSEPKSAAKGSKSQGASSQSTVTNGANSTMAKAARADFFTSPPEPLRLDPFKMFGMARKNPVKEEPVNQVNVSEEIKSPVVEAGDVESDEGTDRQASVIKNMYF